MTAFLQDALAAFGLPELKGLVLVLSLCIAIGLLWDGDDDEADGASKKNRD